jgi:hypothetical protein
MKIIAQLMDVEALEVTETPHRKGQEPKIRIGTLRDWSSLKATGNEAISNITEVDIDSTISFEGLDIVKVYWIGGNVAMCVYFASPVDVAIVEGEPINIPFAPLETPFRSIRVTDLTNVQPPLTGEN